MIKYERYLYDFNFHSWYINGQMYFCNDNSNRLIKRDLWNYTFLEKLF